MMAEAQKIVMDEAPWTFIAYPNYTMARKADLQGLDLLHLEQHPLPGLQPRA